MLMKNPKPEENMLHKKKETVGYTQNHLINNWSTKIESVLANYIAIDQINLNT